MRIGNLSEFVGSLRNLFAQGVLVKLQSLCLRRSWRTKYEKFQEYKQQNPNVSKEDVAQYLAKNRSAGREKLEKFLTPEQLAKWDAEIAKAKDFLSTRAASA